VSSYRHKIEFFGTDGGIYSKKRVKSSNGYTIGCKQSFFSQGHVIGPPSDTIRTLLEMVMEILTFMGNLPRIGCAGLFIAWEKKSHKCVGNFITDVMVILPYLKISHGYMALCLEVGGGR
jgi:hypothetical protein